MILQIIDADIDDIMTVRSFLAVDLDNVVFSSPLPGIINGNPVLMARTKFSWSGVTGGDATSNFRPSGSAMNTFPPSTPATGTTHPAGLVQRTAYGSSSGANTEGFSTSNVLLGLRAADPADGAEFSDLISTSATAGAGTMTPFPLLWVYRLSNAGLAYTAGTVTIDYIELHG